MTEQPDTAKIRAGSEVWPRDIAWHRHTLVVLCEALDAARADKAIWRRHVEGLSSRAEAAEARTADIERRLRASGLPNYWFYCDQYP